MQLNIFGNIYYFLNLELFIWDRFLKAELIGFNKFEC